MFSVLLYSCRCVLCMYVCACLMYEVWFYSPAKVMHYLALPVSEYNIMYVLLSIVSVFGSHCFLCVF